MCEEQKLMDELGKTFQKFKRLRDMEMLNAFNNMRCCDCGHNFRLRNARQVDSRTKNSKSNAIIVACFIFVILIAILWIYLARQYNLAMAYGTGGCISTFFYVSNDCEVEV